MPGKRARKEKVGQSPVSTGKYLPVKKKIEESGVAWQKSERRKGRAISGFNRRVPAGKEIKSEKAELPGKRARKEKVGQSPVSTGK